MGDEIEALGAAPGGDGRVWFRAKVVALKPRYPPLHVRYTVRGSGEGLCYPLGFCYGVPLHRRSYPAELPPPFYLHWTQHRLQCSSSARLWAAACVPGGIWPFGGRNALRRPKKVKKAMEAQYNQDKCVLLLCDFRSCE